MCAGVQNVSRPIEMCHEMSQYPPNASEVTAAARHHTYHGIEATLRARRRAFRDASFGSDCYWKAAFPINTSGIFRRLIQVDCESDFHSTVTFGV